MMVERKYLSKSATVVSRKSPIRDRIRLFACEVPVLQPTAPQANYRVRFSKAETTPGNAGSGS
jgi:hypothetical protein